ncbi:hypothetical protein [Treponema brennaborense]|uniref:Uncharacterized protein n=1 Tax=Treponema brennaborense (strain DSM 12168 / CIP 105900 / DD5/3) TaxID=906968 RepID=F4LLF5_TREBD|nr:hypothetical protein [Treponema brennaborense]AEE16619.1 hypothetical protein Trebr_1191 [Treponema brennaborense DSM 12168]
MKSALRRLLPCICIIFAFQGTVLSAEASLFRKPARILHDAELAFKNGQYGTSLRLLGEAKDARINECTAAVEMLEQALSPVQVQNAGDSISDVVAVLRARDVYEASDLIEYVSAIHGLDFFDNSVKSLIAYIRKMSAFPEAEYLTGKIYELEGENDLARYYYSLAWEHADTLDIPGQKYDILYDMAGLSYKTADADGCEKALLLILADDPYYTDTALTEALFSSVRKGYAADKFFSLYRTDCYRSIPAYYKLTELYAEQGRSEEACKSSMLGVLTALTRMYSIVLQRNTEYEYVSLDNFCAEAMKYPDIAEWSVQTGFWNCLYRFAGTALETFPENADFSRSFLQLMQTCAPEPYWRQLASRLLLGAGSPF